MAGYPALQLARALVTAEQHDDPVARERAALRADRWTSVILGIITRTTDVGSRTPVDGQPAWATLDVVKGGFATGSVLSGGDLQPHEQALLGLPQKGPAALSHPEARLALNGRFLTDEGLQSLADWLQSGRYDIAVPEEGALLVVAWLVQQGFAQEARDLVAVLAPFFSQMRFYPVPLDAPRRHGTRLHLEDAGTTAARLRARRPNRQILAQKEAIEVWTPLYDQMVGLFLETVEGEPPHALRQADGAWVRTPGGGFCVTGGWPCARYPAGWRDRATGLLEQQARLGSVHGLCGRPRRPDQVFVQLLGHLRQCIAAPQSLSGRDVGRIRLILARYVAKRGLPASDVCRNLRQRQAAHVAAPTFHWMAQVVARRLDARPPNEGVDDLGSIVAPIQPQEAAHAGVPGGVPLPPSLHRKVQRCLNDTADALVQRGIITSGETLARVLPQITSGLRSLGVTDPALRHLYAALYRAFRRRRSLLLLDLQSQVRLEELPWVAAIERFRSDTPSARDLALQTLEELSLLAVTAFPQATLPNKLLQELKALATAAGLQLPLVEELAADIFMGEFSPKYLAAARTAARLLQGTLYARYYGIDCPQLAGLQDEPAAPPRDRSRPSPFAALCTLRADVPATGWSVAANGMVIEQQQILTTQNLAVLFDALNMHHTLKGQLEPLARRCFAWVCNRLQVRADTGHARLIHIKNAAYAWRQMVFYLSWIEGDELHGFMAWAQSQLHAQPPGFRQSFEPALERLRSAGGSPAPDGPVFLGWSCRQHWLLAGTHRQR